jgi:hypothetical protein
VAAITADRRSCTTGLPSDRYHHGIQIQLNTGRIKFYDSAFKPFCLDPPIRHAPVVQGRAIVWEENQIVKNRGIAEIAHEFLVGADEM